MLEFFRNLYNVITYILSAWEELVYIANPVEDEE